MIKKLVGRIAVWLIEWSGVRPLKLLPCYASPTHDSAWEREDGRGNKVARLLLPNGIEMVVHGTKCQCSIVSPSGDASFVTPLCEDPTEALLAVSLRMLGYDTGENRAWLYNTSPARVRKALEDGAATPSERWLYHADVASGRTAL